MRAPSSLASNGEQPLITVTEQDLYEKKEKKPTVLEDDEYVERLGRIIRRDFYPDLHRAYESGLLTHVESNKFKYKASYETDPLGVDAFHSKFTSEDNASFQQLHDSDKEAHKRKYWWAFQNDISDKRLLLHDKHRLSSNLVTDAKKPKLLKDKYKARGTQLTHAATRFRPREIDDDKSVISDTSAITARTEELIPSVNGYTFVTTPASGLGLSSGARSVVRPDSVRSEFSIKQRSRREEAAHSLARKVESAKRKSKREEMERQRRCTPYRSAGRREREMTPAARALAQRLGSVRRKG